MMKETKIKTKLNVLVKKWFDKINGNSYHSIEFMLGKEHIHSGLTYGYETQYTKLLLKNILLKILKEIY